MVHGAPDYYNAKSVAAQPGDTEMRIQIRPTYGAWKRLYYSDTVPGGVTTSLGSIAGKGMIYGGNILISSTGVVDTDFLQLLLDGTVFSNPMMQALNLFSLSKETCNPFYLLKWDSVLFVYAVGFMPGISFETSVQVRYSEAVGRTPQIIMQLFYALI